MSGRRNVTVPGQVRKGAFVPDDPVLWSIALREHDGAAVELTLAPKRERRSTRANARYWSILIALAKHHLNTLRGNEVPPLSSMQVHEVLAGAFIGHEETPLGLVRCETKNLTQKQFYEYAERVALWLRENGYAIPEQGEPVEMPE